MFKTMIKMFQTAEKEARAFQRTIAAEMKAYYKAMTKTMKKAEKEMKKQEKKEFLAICADVARMFKNAEPKTKKTTTKKATPVPVITQETAVVDFEVNCGPVRVFNDCGSMICYRGAKFVNSMEIMDSPYEVCEFIMKCLKTKCPSVYMTILAGVRKMQVFDGYSESNSDSSSDDTLCYYNAQYDSIPDVLGEIEQDCETPVVCVDAAIKKNTSHGEDLRTTPFIAIEGSTEEYADDIVITEFIQFTMDGKQLTEDES